MVKNFSILNGVVFHKRLFPKVNSFKYSMNYLYASLNLLSLNSLKLLSLNKINVFSFYYKDHGDRKGSDLDSWIRKILVNEQINNVDGDIILLTLPRIFNYVFNPVSFFLCFDKKQRLRAILAEVNNTFGENHSYLITNKELKVIEQDDELLTKKLFHVSPFITSKEGYYVFKFNISNYNICIQIDYYDSKDNKILMTSIKGKLTDLNDKNLFIWVIKYPLTTLKVIFLIYFQALKLWLKGLKYIKKPEHSNNQISR